MILNFFWTKPLRCSKERIDELVFQVHELYTSYRLSFLNICVFQDVGEQPSTVWRRPLSVEFKSDVIDNADRVMSTLLDRAKRQFEEFELPGWVRIPQWTKVHGKCSGKRLPKTRSTCTECGQCTRRQTMQRRKPQLTVLSLLVYFCRFFLFLLIGLITYLCMVRTVSCSLECVFWWYWVHLVVN